MKITIDNQDGLGPVDYTLLLAGAAPLKIQRRLNAPSVCTAAVSVTGTAVSAPARNGRVLVIADNGTLLFSGYVANEPSLHYVGVGLAAAAYVAEVAAVSDDTILDRQPMSVAPRTVSQGATDVLRIMTARVDSARAGLAAGGTTAITGSFTPDAASSWSENAATLATMARAAYRVVNGQVSLRDIGSTVHTFSESDSTLNLQTLSVGRTKMLVNDVTVCGEEEPQAYVTEVFQGDGTTASFTLSERPFSISGQKARLVLDDFTGSTIDPRVWSVSDPGSRLSLTAQGLSCSGGNGLDGQTVVAALDTTELGGVLLLEALGVQTSGASDGYVGCLYNGVVELANLFAGFHIKQGPSGAVVAGVVKGAEIGSAAPLSPGHLYSLRVRVHCGDYQRVLQSYVTAGSSGRKSFGGDLLPGAADLVMEMQDMTPGALLPAVVLYDGRVQSAPASCTLVAVNSPAFVGSIGQITWKQEPGVWITVTPNAGSQATQRLGTATETANAKITAAGKLTFFPTSVPANGALVRVTYRTSGRAVARLADGASQAAEASQGVPGTAQLICSVDVPATRSSADCENAALALLTVASDRAAAWSGRYAAANLQATGDIWPGDALAITAPSAGLNEELIVRDVTVEYMNAVPEFLQYSMTLANAWAEMLSIKTSASVPTQVWLPPAALSAPTALTSLSALAVTAITATEIDISAAATAPPGGGFEVRRADWRFRPGNDSDLVLRSPVPNFSIPREGPVEQYFVRMYDGAQPPNYSRFSSAIVVNVMV